MRAVAMLGGTSIAGINAAAGCGRLDIKEFLALL